MWQLWLGVILFGGPHVWSSLLPKSRDGLKASLGEKRFKGLYSVATGVGLALLAWAYVIGRTAAGGPGQLYEPAHSLRHPAMLLVLAAFILIFANGSQSHIRQWLKHPFSIGVMLWSGAHLLVNGETTVVVIFATLFLIALLDVVFSFARGKIPNVSPRWSHDLRSVVIGLVLYLAFLFGFHPHVLGIPVI